MCSAHLDDKENLHRYLLLRLRFIRKSYVIKRTQIFLFLQCLRDAVNHNLEWKYSMEIFYRR